MKTGLDRDRRQGEARPQRKLIITIPFIHDLQHWIGIDPRLALRIIRMMLEIDKDPWRGIGKPELLKHDLAGHWSRRVTDEHRLIYRFDAAEIAFLSARAHYA